MSPSVHGGDLGGIEPAPATVGIVRAGEKSAADVGVQRRRLHPEPGRGFDGVYALGHAASRRTLID
jgi:hypothetical protein